MFEESTDTGYGAEQMDKHIAALGALSYIQKIESLVMKVFRYRKHNI